MNFPCQAPNKAELGLEASTLAQLRQKIEGHLSGIAAASGQPGFAYNAICDTHTFEAICYLALERVKELQYFNSRASEARQ